MRKAIPASLFVIIALAACSPKEETPAAIVRPVLVQVAHPTVSETAGPFVGAIAPRYQTPLSFQLPGRVIARSVGVGDIVTSNSSSSPPKPIWPMHAPSSTTSPPPKSAPAR